MHSYVYFARVVLLFLWQGKVLFFSWICGYTWTYSRKTYEEWVNNSAWWSCLLPRKIGILIFVCGIIDSFKDHMWIPILFHKIYLYPLGYHKGLHSSIVCCMWELDFSAVRRNWVFLNLFWSWSSCQCLFGCYSSHALLLFFFINLWTQKKKKWSFILSRGPQLSAKYYKLDEAVIMTQFF